MKKIDNVLENATFGYTRFSINCQWEVSEFVLKLQELTASDDSQSDLLQNKNRLSLKSSTNHVLKCQTQLRLQLVCEVADTKATNKVSSALQKWGISPLLVGKRNDTMVILAATKAKQYDLKMKLAATKVTKKISSALQNWGFSQVLIGEQNDIVVTGKTAVINHCSF